MNAICFFRNTDIIALDQEAAFLLVKSNVKRCYWELVIASDAVIKDFVFASCLNELPNIPTNCPKHQRTSQYSNELTHKSNEPTQYSNEPKF